MTTQTAVRRQHLQQIVELARLSAPVLSVYLDADPLKTMQDEVRLRARGLFQAMRQDLHAPNDVLNGFERAREAVEGFLAGAKLAERGIAVFASPEGKILQHAYLPSLLVRDAVRFGPGADVLPVLDVLDELEPVIVCRIERNQATTLVVEAGEIGFRKHFQSEVPQRSRATNRESLWSAPKFQQHEEEHERRHYRRVADFFTETLRSHPTRRLFLGGPTEAVTGLRQRLNGPIAALVKGTFRTAGYASDAALRDAAIQAAAQEERKGEEELVQELIQRGLKDDRAVLGAYATAYAIQQGGVHHLVVAADGAPVVGRRCSACGHVGPSEETHCPVCQNHTDRADLGRELVLLAVQHHYPVELVHGPAAALLSQHQGMGALLKFPSAT